jgi:spore germination protein GerM
MRALLVAAAFTLALTGCGQKDKPAAQPEPKRADAPADTKTPAATPNTPDKKEAAVKLYFGDENGEKLVEKQLKITYAADSDKYMAALNALKTAPDAKTVSLFGGFTFKSAALDKSDLRVDLSLDANGQLGSEGEELMLQALQKTLFQFPEVQNIYITEDGKQVDSLMGHMDLPYPIKRK